MVLAIGDGAANDKHAMGPGCRFHRLNFGRMCLLCH